jgi:RNA polymerase sigma-70 factor (ECF subfamily)
MAILDYEEKKDEALMLAFQIHKDEVAIETLIRRRQTAVLRFCLNRVGKKDAEDVTQQVFLMMIQGKYQPERGEFICWLFGIALNCCRKHLQKAKTVRNQLDQLERLSRQKNSATNDEGTSMDDEGLKVEMAEAALRSFRALPEKYRLALELHVQQGMSFQQIGAIIGTSQASAHRLTEKAKLLLRKHLMGLGYTGVNAGVVLTALKHSFDSLSPLPVDLAGKILAAHDGGSVGVLGVESVRIGRAAFLGKAVWAAGAAAVIGAIGIGIWPAQTPLRPEPNDFSVPPNSAPNGSPNTKETKPLLKIIEGEGRFLSQAGPNGAECLEVENGTTVLIDRPIQKLPIFVSYQYQLPEQSRQERGFRLLTVWENSRCTALFKNLTQKTLIEIGDERWFKGKIFVAANYTLDLSDGTFDLMVEDRAPAADRLKILARGKFRLANFVIQEEIPPTVKIPDVSEYLEALQNIPAEERRGIVSLPTLRAHDPNKPISVQFIYAQTVPPKADVKP